MIVLYPVLNRTVWRHRWVGSLVLLSLVMAFSHAFGEEAVRLAHVSKCENCMVSDLSIQIDSDIKPVTRWQSIAHDLITVHTGKLYRFDAIQYSVNALYLCRQFKTVTVETKREGNGIAVIFKLQPFKFIKDIKVYGHYPLFEQDVLNAMTIYPGDVFSESELYDQKNRLEELLSRNGFILPHVDLTWHDDIDNGTSGVIVTVRMKKSRYFKIKRIEIHGDDSFSDLRLKLKMRSWIATLIPGSSGRLVEQRLQQDIKKLERFYYEKHFPDAKISYYVEYDAGDTVVVIVEIEEGPKYDIAISGNDAFFKMTLKNDLVLFERGNINDRGIRKSIVQLEERYHNAGFPDVAIDTADNWTKRGRTPVRNIKINIAENTHEVVKSVRISGNHRVTDKKIRKQMLTRPPGIILGDGGYVESVLDEDIRSIKELYAENGFMDADIRRSIIKYRHPRDPENVRISVRVDILEGTQTVVGKIDFDGLTVIPGKTIIKQLEMTVGDSFSISRMKDDEARIAAEISEYGYPHVTVNGNFRRSSDRRHAYIHYVVNEGPYVQMGHYYYTGNFKTNATVMDREIRVDEDQPFSLSKMLRTQRDIQELDIFKSVQFKTIGLKEKADTVHLFAEIEEKKRYILDTGVGYNSEDGGTFDCRVGNRNVFGRNKSIWINFEQTQTGRDTSLSLTEPRLSRFKIRTTLDLAFSDEEKPNLGFSTLSQTATLSFSRTFISYLATSVQLIRESRDKRAQYALDDASENIYNEEDTREIFTSIYAVSYDRRDSIIRPRSGYLVSLSTKISDGLNKEDNDDFITYQVDLRYYWSPLPRLTLAFMGRRGWITAFGSMESIPDDQLFYLGGGSSVRGFEENMLWYENKNGTSVSLGGIEETIIIAEARLYLGRNFELALFHDAGKLSDHRDKILSEDFRTSVGFGIRYLTAIGPIGIMYGFKTAPLPDEIINGPIHFSIGYSF